MIKTMYYSPGGPEFHSYIHICWLMTASNSNSRVADPMIHLMPLASADTGTLTHRPTHRVTHLHISKKSIKYKFFN